MYPELNLLMDGDWRWVFCGGRRGLMLGLWSRDGRGRLVLENRDVWYADTVGGRRVVLGLGKLVLDGLIC
jgi:hypothetical protein